VFYITDRNQQPLEEAAAGRLRDKLNTALSQRLAA
jgi:hypothetical protein